MRLFEIQSGVVPDLRQFITPQLIDDIIRDGKWVEHGSPLEDWLDTSCFATDNEAEIGIDGRALESLPHDEQRKHPDFRKCISYWFELAMKQIEEDLHRGRPHENIPPFTPNMPLFRCMAVDEEWLKQTDPKFGVYWSADIRQAQRFIREPDLVPLPNQPGHYSSIRPKNTHRFPDGKMNVLMKVRAGHAHVDWYQTLRSRLDYNHGMDEAEFQLLRDAPMGPVTIKILHSGEVITRIGHA